MTEAMGGAEVVAWVSVGVGLGAGALAGVGSVVVPGVHGAAALPTRPPKLKKKMHALIY